VDWEELRNQNIFISGGAGWFGRWMVETLLYANNKLNLNCKIVVLTNSNRLSIDPNVSFWQGDINNVEFPRGEFSYVIHLVPCGTERMLKFAKKCKANKFLFTSSGAVYQLHPNEYAQTKICDEYLCASNNQYFETKIARCFSFVGPYIPLDKNFAIGNFIGSAIKGKEVFIRNADNTPWRSYLYMSDLAIWLWTILFKGQANVFYNVGGEIAYTIRVIGEMVANIAGVPVKYDYIYKQQYDDYIPYIGHTVETLGLHELIFLDEGIRRTLEFYKK
jgi:dTDP-glucose 4,6-dehydratase